MFGKQSLGRMGAGVMVWALAAACSAPAPATQADPAATASTAPTARATDALAATTPAEALAVLPACTGSLPPTPAQTEGPYYTSDTPERESLLEPGMSGTPLIVTGYVLTTDCRPIVNALLDFWQADAAGAYDNTGYRLRGHEFSDAAGRYRLETILPGLYPGRTRHIHVKVQAPGQPALTTQLYFPDEPNNQRDGIFNPDLIVTLDQTSSGPVATFNFVLSVP